MFEFLFKYPSPVFAKGRFVLLGTWPGWVLPLLIVFACAGMGWLIRSRLADAVPNMRTWRAVVVWAMQSALLAVVLLLLWQPAISVAELKSQQNIIAVLVDDSRSMGVADSGAAGTATRETEALKTLNDGVLRGLQKRFQTRLYRVDRELSPVAQLADLQPSGSATHLNESLRRLAADTSDLPVGAIVLLSDGAANEGGIDQATLSALRNRRLPVHTIGFGKTQSLRDIEMDDVKIAPEAMADSRMSATVMFHQRGYAKGTTVLQVRDGEKLLTRAAGVPGARRRGTKRNRILQRRAGWGETRYVCAEASGCRGERCEQCNGTDGDGARGQTPDPLRGRRAAMGVQVHSAGGGR